ncbi:MAG: ATP-dependent Clp protease ATP-binding subunit, partial [Delftia sp.]|nr:ATP-dependent Clp protease ATP-binding subunit [Delftia sp.]
ILANFAQERGFKLARLEDEIERLTRTHAGRDARMDLVDDHGGKTPLSEEMLTVLDEALTIAQALDELQVAPEHALAAMSQKGISTAGVLQRHGVTPRAMSPVLQSSSRERETLTRDLVALAREGELTPLHYRESLLRKLVNLLSLARERHVILTGPAGVGKRSLAISLAHRIVEGHGPTGLDKVVTISQAALIDAPDRAVRAGLRQARGGILLLPGLQRFFERTVRNDVRKAAREIQQALLNDDPVIIGTSSEGDYDKILAADSAVSGHSHTLRVPPTDAAETEDILNVQRGQLESEYAVKIDPDSLETAVTMSQRYLGETPQPKSALHLFHRACALVR